MNPLRRKVLFYARNVYARLLIALCAASLIVGAGGLSVHAAHTVIAVVNVGFTPTGIAINPSTNRIYVANNADDTLTIIDGNTNTPLETIAVGDDLSTDNPFHVAVNQLTNRVYVTNSGSNTVSVVDGYTGAVLDTLPVGEAPYGIAANPVTNRIYVANNGSNTLSVIDGITSTVIDNVAVADNPLMVAVDPVSNRIYVSTLAQNSVSIIDGSTNTVIATLTTPDQPRFIAIHRNRIYVSNGVSLSIIDGSTNTIVDSILLGFEPDGIAINPVTDRMYATNGSASTVSVINLSSKLPIDIVSVVGSPQGVALNPGSGYVYVANVGGNAVSIIHEIPEATPTPTSPSVLKVQYKAGDTARNVRLIRSFFKIVNTGDTPVPLSELTVRYWYTADSDESQFSCCVYAGFNCKTLTRRFVRLLLPHQNADSYIEFSFTPEAGFIPPHKTTGAIVNWFFKWPLVPYNQSNDYSFDPTYTTYNDYPRMTLYRNGVLIWGVEPPLLSSTSAATKVPVQVPTNTPTRR